jgi:hypothetical protein
MKTWLDIDTVRDNYPGIYLFIYLCDYASRDYASMWLCIYESILFNYLSMYLSLYEVVKHYLIYLSIYLALYEVVKQLHSLAYEINRKSLDRERKKDRERDVSMSLLEASVGCTMLSYYPPGIYLSIYLINYLSN